MGYIKTLMIEMQSLGIPWDIGEQHPCSECGRKQSCVAVKDSSLLWVQLMCTHHECKNFMQGLWYTVPQDPGKEDV